MPWFCMVCTIRSSSSSSSSRIFLRSSKGGGLAFTSLILENNFLNLW